MRGDGGTSEARKLSYRALDIEQIGHVYEGLLDHVAVRVDTDTLGLAGPKDKEPELSLDELDRERRRSRDGLIEFLKEHTGRSTSALCKDLDAGSDEDTEQRLLVACGNDKALVKRIAPYHALLRKDVWGYPQIYRAGSSMVTGGPERRQTGTHYTPKSLTEQIVTETLEPLVYVGPAEGKPRDSWKLRTPAELLDLKICDMAMGSGAFLVQVCRWLGERVVEAWEEAERQGAAISADGDLLAKSAGHDLLPAVREERLSLARRLVAERCVYGVDINPMAVELAKLSLWLVTLAKGRPFGFLDHNLRSGDSLLGVTRLEQLENFHLEPVRGKRLHHTLFDPRHEIQGAVTKALELRQRLRAIRILDIEDVRAMARLDEGAKAVLRLSEFAADLLVGAAIDTAGSRGESLDEKLVTLTDCLKEAIDRRADTIRLETQARGLLDTDCPDRLRPRRPFHWGIEFPEVFVRDRPGFDAIVGNPPFMGGQKLTGAFGTNYREHLVAWLASGARGSADLVAYFFLRAYGLLRHGGNFGLLAVNTIAEGDTRQVGLEPLVKGGAIIYAAYPNEPWPGRAAVVTSRVHMHKGEWRGSRSIFGRPVPFISPFLSDREEWSPKRLKANEHKAFQGAIVLGMGFVIAESEAQEMIRKSPRNRDVLFPYLNGEDLNSDPEQQASRWVINFWDWPEERARTYREPFEIVKTKAKPERMRQNDRGGRENWWRFLRPRPELYHAIGRGHQFERHPEGWDSRMKAIKKPLCLSRVTKYVAPAAVRGDQVFSDRLVVFASTDPNLHGVLLSQIHEVWVRKHASTFETRLTYTPTDAFETLPSPHVQSQRLAALAREADHARSEFMVSECIGLTDLYNRFHDRTEYDVRIGALRELYQELDREVVRAYGWEDLHPGLQHDFHEVPYLPENDRLRFTIAEQVRIEVLQRLGDLNRARYKTEVGEGLHGPIEAGLVDLGAERRRRARDGRPVVKQADAAYPQGDLDLDQSQRKVAEVRASGDAATGAAHSIREWLATHPGWHAKDEILVEARIATDEWASAIKELVESGTVAKQGERRGAKYRAK